MCRLGRTISLGLIARRCSGVPSGTQAPCAPDPAINRRAVFSVISQSSSSSSVFRVAGTSEPPPVAFSIQPSSILATTSGGKGRSYRSCRSSGVAEWMLVTMVRSVRATKSPRARAADNLRHFPQLLKVVDRLYISRTSKPDHEQSSHDQRLLRHRFSLPIPQGHPVQDRRAHRGSCSHSRRGSKNLVWLRTTSSNDFIQNPSASRSHSTSDRRNASGTVGARRNFGRGISNAFRSPRNCRVSRQ
jgi:hypothetical protein